MVALLSALSTKERALSEVVRSLTLCSVPRCVLLTLLALSLLLVFSICHGSINGGGNDAPTADPE